MHGLRNSRVTGRGWEFDETEAMGCRGGIDREPGIRMTGSSTHCFSRQASFWSSRHLPLPGERSGEGTRPWWRTPSDHEGKNRRFRGRPISRGIRPLLVAVDDPRIVLPTELV